MDLETIRHLLDCGPDVPPLSDAALKIVGCLMEIDRRLSALEAAGKPAPPTESTAGLDALYHAAMDYGCYARPNYGFFGMDIQKAFIAGAEWERNRNPAAYDAARSAIVADELCSKCGFPVDWDSDEPGHMECFIPEY